MEENELTLAAIPLNQLKKDEWKLLRDHIGDSQVIGLGEESHGTQEFYEYRFEITKALVKHSGVSLVMIECDFPAVYEVNRWMHDVEDGREAEEVMNGFKERFPVWMWNNEVTREMVKWMKKYNIEAGSNQVPVDFLGIDIYSLFRSADQVLKYLSEKDPDEHVRAKKLFQALNSFRPDPIDYARGLASRTIKSQEKNIEKILRDLHQKEMEYISVGFDGDEFFSAESNARLMKNAENYYRTMVTGGGDTWDLRDTAMVDTVEAAIKYQKKKFGIEKPKAIIWAHNSHINDCSSRPGGHEVTVGQLLRERFPKAFLMNFSTYQGTVRAAKEWNGKDYVMSVNPSLKNSLGDILHRAFMKLDPATPFGLVFNSKSVDVAMTKEQRAARNVLNKSMLQRFIGVQYIKASERPSHYQDGNPTEMYDFSFFVDHSSAVVKLTGAKVRPGTLDYQKWEDIDETEE